MKLRNSCIFKNTISPAPEFLPKTSVFFDIETTGLSWRTSHLYMIGCAYYAAEGSGQTPYDIRGQESDGRWVLQQWFLEKPSEERDLLEQFAAFLNTHVWKELVHYNGTTFDIPYLRNKYQFYKLEDPLASLNLQKKPDGNPNVSGNAPVSDGTFVHAVSLDLYTKIRSFKKYLCTESLKQRDVECCFGLSRDDCYTGGELISVYQNYLRSGNEQLLDCLWQHNYEDVQNLLPISAGFQAYQQLFNGEFQIVSASFQTTDDGMSVLVADLALSCPIPAVLNCSCEYCTLYAEKNSAELTVPVFEGELRHYFADYKNYYYLPVEDMAIHKSIGSFVDPAHRKKATADTCFQRVSGRFLPQAEEVFSPAFRQTRKDKVSWFRADDVQNAENTSLLFSYIRSMLGRL